MGQQQLLLLVLGIVIVGVAVIVGLQAFAVNQKKANIDAIQLTSMRIASEAQAWLRTPVSYGGGMPTVGGRQSNFQDLTLDIATLGYTTDGSGNYVDLNGVYSGTVNAGNFIITATSASSSGNGDNNIVCTIVSGPLVGDITTEINPASGSCTGVVIVAS
ncbi:MAG: hypothetical protein KTR29_07385 [Rhodothermaceae bacterium]|nr:hypothetical protein [Rhodothermaceae bacterium]